MTREGFKALINQGEAVDYHCNGEDHDFVKKLGYKLKFHNDCSVTAEGLPGISLSSEGAWGTFFGKLMDEKSKEVAFQMIDSYIVTFFRLEDWL